MTEILLVITTVGTRADADRLARGMVDQHLAACAQISALDSVYRWRVAVQTEGEFRLLLKTTARSWPALLAALRAQHPYELPAIVALPCSHALAEFADWVDAQTALSL
jgi:periplasmic divalent cation tolerance protein